MILIGEPKVPNVSEAQHRLDLVNRLNELESLESSADLMSAFRSSLNQIEAVMKDQASDVTAATDKIDQVQESLGDFKNVVEHAKGLLESSALDGASDAASGLDSALGQTGDGVGQLGTKSTKVAEAIEGLSSKLDKIAELEAMGGDQAGKLIAEFGEMIGGIADVLGPLVDLVPGLGALLDMYVKAIESISTSVNLITDVMRSHNLAARQANLPDVYTFTVSGAAARKREMVEIRTELDQIGWFAQPPTVSHTPTPLEARVAVDVSNAVGSGLNACGCGTGAASPEDGWRAANRRLEEARRQLGRAHRAAKAVEWMGRDMTRLEAEAQQAKDALDSATTAAADADAAADAAASAGSSDGGAISDAVDAQHAAADDLNAAESAAIKAQDPLDRFEHARDDLEAAQRKYEESYERVKNCFDQMYRMLPTGEHFDPSRTALTASFSPSTSFETSIGPAAKDLLRKLKGVRKSGPEDRSAVPAMMAVGAGLVVIVILIAFVLTLFGGRDSTDLIGSDPVTEEADSEAVEVPEEHDKPADVADDATDSLDPVLSGIEAILGAAGMASDEIDAAQQRLSDDVLFDWFFSDSAEVPGNPGPDIDLRRSGGWFDSVSDEDLGWLFANTVFECGDVNESFRTVCDSNFPPSEFETTEMLVATEVFAGPVAQGPWHYVYSAVFDTDGDSANNFVATDPYDWDQYQGTDRWWVLTVVDETYELGRYDGSFDRPVETAARVAVADDTIVFFIPRDEAGDVALWRPTAFRHDGTYRPEVSAGDVSGANPTGPLASFETLDATFASQG